MYLEQVKSYKHLGATVNIDKSTEEEIKNRITLRNKAYYANQFFFKSGLVSKKLKIKFVLEHYKTNSDMLVKHGF